MTSVAAAILRRIVADGVRHVGACMRWFGYGCAWSGLKPAPTWETLVKRWFRGRIRPQCNDSAHDTAGLTRDYYTPLATA